MRFITEWSVVRPGRPEFLGRLAAKLGFLDGLTGPVVKVMVTSPLYE